MFLEAEPELRILVCMILRESCQEKGGRGTGEQGTRLSKDVVSAGGNLSPSPWEFWSLHCAQSWALLGEGLVIGILPCPHRSLTVGHTGESGGGCVTSWVGVSSQQRVILETRVLVNV